MKNVAPLQVRMRAPLPHNDMVPHSLMGVQMQRRPLLLQVIRRIEMDDIS